MNGENKNKLFGISLLKIKNNFKYYKYNISSLYIIILFRLKKNNFFLSLNNDGFKIFLNFLVNVYISINKK